MKKLYVCGDSWSSASVLTPGKHYSEIVASNINYELVSIARGGMSNGGICLQIEHAIKHNADFVILSTTVCDRWEAPITSPKRLEPTVGDFYDIYDHNRYDFNAGLGNVLYEHEEYLSTANDFVNKNPTMISDNFSSMIYRSNVLTSDQKTALKYHLSELLDRNWKEQIDVWCVRSCLRDLLNSGIPFIVFMDPLNLKNTHHTHWIPSHNYMNIDVTPYQKPMTNDPGYHTGPDEQIQMANILLTHIKENFNL